MAADVIGLGGILDEEDRIMRSLSQGGVGGSSRFLPHVHGGDGGGGKSISSSAPANEPGSKNESSASKSSSSSVVVVISIW